MKILFVSLNHAPEQTGIGKYQGEMAAWFATKGHDIRVMAAPPYYPEWKVASGHSAWLYRQEMIDGVRVDRVPLYVPARPTGLKRLIHMASFCTTIFPLLLWRALVWRPSVIVLTAPPLMVAPLVLLAGKVSGAKVHMHVQDFEVDAAFGLGLLDSQRFYKMALAAERWLLSHFTTVSTISPKMLQKLLDKGVDKLRAFLVPNWANVEAFAPTFGGGKWIERFKKEEGSILALYSGNLGRKQGLEVIIEAARLLEREASPIHFVVSGDGAGREDMQKQAEGLKNITFIPLQPMEDFVHLMIAADIHLLPQRAQAADLVMPSKLGNILASGRPVVVGADEGTQIYEAVQGCGIVVPPENGVAFAAAIKELAADASRRAVMGEKGQQQAKENWGKESLLRRMESVLQKCAAFVR